jgi:uncharacterized membrane protein YoaK (UPF0700 family)
MADANPNDSRLPPALLGLTAVTGLVDAVSFLGLGRVFTANMTGNVVFIGFALAGAPGLSAVRSLTALGAFLAGAALGGRIVARADGEALVRAARLTVAIETALLAAAAVAAVGGPPGGPPVRPYALIVLTALAMGVRNASVRKLAVADLTTTVLTLTLTGLAADSSLAGGANPRWRRRVASALAMLGGAAVGAWLTRRSLAITLGVAGVASLLAGLALRKGAERPRSA